MNMPKFLIDKTGKPSSKRISGLSALFLAFLICVGAAIAYLCNFTQSIDQVGVLLYPLFGFASIALGIGTALEKVAP